jgi:hypothetical protein
MQYSSNYHFYLIVIIDERLKAGFPGFSLGNIFLHTAYMFDQKNKKTQLGQARDCGSYIVSIHNQSLSTLQVCCLNWAQNITQENDNSGIGGSSSSSLSTLIFLASVTIAAIMATYMGL